MRPMRRLLALSLGFAVLAMPVFAQLTRGTILGSVQDPSGAMIAGATVKIVNTGTNISRSSTTGSDGFYRLPGVDPGSYTVTFGATGFAETQVHNIEVTTSQEVTLN